MRFNWINGINTAAVALLILINVIAGLKGAAGDFKSKHPAVNIFEQVGRYACMAFMIFPILKGMKFGFGSVAEMLIWICLTALLLVVYGLLWVRKPKGGAPILYGLAIVPAVLFLINGILLRYPALIAAALLFGIFHVIIAAENAG